MEIIKSFQSHHAELIAAWAAIAATWLVLQNFIKALQDALGKAQDLKGIQKILYVFWAVVAYLAAGKRPQ